MFIPSYEVTYDSCLLLLKNISSNLNRRFRNDCVDYHQILGLLIWNINLHQEKDSSYFCYEVAANTEEVDPASSCSSHFIELFSIPVLKQSSTHDHYSLKIVHFLKIDLILAIVQDCRKKEVQGKRINSVLNIVNKKVHVGSSNSNVELIDYNFTQDIINVLQQSYQLRVPESCSEEL